MPLKVRVDRDLRVIFVHGGGVVTDDDLLGYVRDYLTDQELKTYDELFDLSEADLLDLTYQGLSGVAAAAAESDPRGAPVKIAILVSEMRGLGISRWYQSLREAKGGRRQTRVFRDRAECKEWLGLES